MLPCQMLSTVICGWKGNLTVVDQAASAILVHEVEIQRSVPQMGAEPSEVLREAAAVEAHDAASAFLMARSFAISRGLAGGGSLPVKE